MNIKSLVLDVKENEGFKSDIYLCPAGKRTIGYGFNLENGITVQLATIILRTTLKSIFQELKLKIPFIVDLSCQRQNVLVEMAYNMGVAGLLKFKKTLKFIELGQYEKASKEMLDSKWHRDFIRLAPGTNVEKLRSSQLSVAMLRG